MENQFGFNPSDFGLTAPVPSNDVSTKIQTQSPTPGPTVSSNILENPLAGAVNAFGEAAKQITPSTNISTAYPKELTEKYIGTAAYSPWMDPYSDNEKAAAQNWSRWDAVKTGLSGMLDNALLAGKEYGRSYIRAGEALLNLDASYLKPDEMDLRRTAAEQKLTAQANPIFFSPGTEDDIFSKQFLAEALQNTGFTFGTMGGFLIENAVFGGIGKLTSSLSELAKAGAVGESLHLANQIGTTTRAGNKALTLANSAENLIKNGTLGSIGGKNAWDNALDIASKIPYLGEVADAGKIAKAGASLGLTTRELANIGAGGLRRAFSEWHFAASEAAVEAGGNFGDVYDNLYQQYVKKNGQEPTGAALDDIRAKAMSSAGKDYGVNLAILGITNKVMFGNMFRNFGVDNAFMGLLRSEGDRVISVVGKDAAGKLLQKDYARNILGAVGHFGDIATTFGSKQLAFKEVGKDLIRGLSKFELTEGIQENLQDIATQSLKTYYNDLYDDNMADWNSALADGFASQASVQGWKTFLQGAMTGFFVGPVTNTITHLNDAWKEKRAKDANPNHVNGLQQTLDQLNLFYANPNKVLSEPVKAIKRQMAFNDEMVKSAAKGKKYEYFNNKDSALIAHALYAKRVGSFDAFSKFIEAYGTQFDNKEFEEATGLNLKQMGMSSPAEFTSKLSGQLNRYSEIYDKYNKMFGDYLTLNTVTDDPYKKQRFSFAQMAMRNAIETIAFNEAKAERSVSRAASISANISKIESIGQSAAANFNTITSHDKAANQILILQNELKLIKESKDKSPQTLELIRDKEEEIDLLTRWNEEAYKEVINKNDPSDRQYVPLNHNTLSDAKKTRLAATISKYYNIKNKQSNVVKTINSRDVIQSLNDINDYQKLSRDTKDYIDAVNLLSDPDNMIKHVTAHQDAIIAAYARLVHKTYKNGLARVSGIFEQYIKDNPNDLKELLKMARSPFTSAESIGKIYHHIDNLNKLQKEEYTANRDKQLQKYLKKKEELQKKLEELKLKAADAAAKAKEKALKQQEEQDRKEFNKAVVVPLNVKSFSDEDLLNQELSDRYLIFPEDPDLPITHIERQYIDYDGDYHVTHVIPIEDIIKYAKDQSNEDITPESSDIDDWIKKYTKQFEQDLYDKVNPSKASAPNQKVQRSKTVSTLARKIQNLENQAVLMNGKKGVIKAIKNKKSKNYIIEFEDGTSSKLTSLKTVGVDYVWEQDNAGDFYLVEAEPQTGTILDEFYDVLLLPDNLEDQDKEEFGITANSQVARIGDQVYHYEYIDNDRLTLDGDTLILTRTEDGELESATVLDGEDQYIIDLLNPKNIEFRNAISWIILKHTPAADIQNLEPAVNGIDNQSSIESSNIATSNQVISVRQDNSFDEIGDLATKIYLNIGEDLFEIMDRFLVNPDNLTSDEISKLQEWGIESIIKLTNLEDPTHPLVADYISFINNSILLPSYKKNGKSSSKKTKSSASKTENAATGKTSKRKSTTRKPGTPTSYKGKSIKEAREFVEKTYDKKDKETAIKITTKTSSKFAAEEYKNIVQNLTEAEKAYSNIISQTPTDLNDPFLDDLDLNCNI
jgi:hypothetical protein